MPLLRNRAYAWVIMPTITDEAVCIRHWDFSETSQTVSLFTRSGGLLRGLAKGSKRPKARFSGGIELLTRGKITAIVKASSDLATLTEWDLEEIFPGLVRRLDAYYASMYFIDLIGHLVVVDDPHPRLFEMLVHSLRVLNGGAVGGGGAMEMVVPGQMLQFQWALLCETGYQPILDRDAETGAALVDGDGFLRVKTLAFSRSAGGTVADTGAGDRWRVRGETVHLLREVEAAWATPVSGAPSASSDSTDLDTTMRLPAQLDETVDLVTIGWHER